MHLTDILKEVFLAEKIVKIPDEELAKIDKLYNYLKRNRVDFRLSAPKRYSKSKPDPKLDGLFKLNDLRGNPIDVKISYYNNTEDGNKALAGGSTIFINLSNMTNLADFKEVMEHELIHLIDPKANDPKLANSLLKRGRVSDKYDFSNPENVRKYYKDVAEFDAFTAPLVKLIKRNLDSTGEYRKEFKANLANLLYDAKTTDYLELVKDPRYTKRYEVGDQVWDTIRLFSNAASWKGEKSKWENKITMDFWDVANMLNAWATQPTLYKRFVKRLGTEI